MKIRKHSLRYWIDPWYRRRTKRLNKALKYVYGPIIIDGIYKEHPLERRLRERRK